jgi:hypothetical protein
MTSFEGMASGVARSWVSLYTAGVDRAVGERRRREIDSDVWEQLHDEDSGRLAAAAVVVRTLLGVPADLTWRIEMTSRVLVVERSGQMLVYARQNPWQGLAVVLSGVALLVWGIIVAYSALGEHISSTAEDIAFVAAVLAGAAIVGCGVVAGVRGRTGAALLQVLVGVVVIAVAYFFGPTTW